MAFFNSMFGYCVIVSPFYCLIRFLMIRKTSFQLTMEILYFSFFLYSVCIFSQTILPSRAFLLGHETAVGRSNFMLFHTIQYYIHQLGGPMNTVAVYNLVGNIVLFVPFGFYIPMIWCRFRGHFKMILISFSIPLFIEVTQHFIGRSIDVDDVLLNTIAILLGYGLFIISNRIIEKTRYQSPKKLR